MDYDAGQFEIAVIGAGHKGPRRAGPASSERRECV